MFKSVIIAGIGGFIGTALRFVISRYFQLHYISVFPWSTFLINILGSFLIGIFFGLSEKGNILSPEWRIFLTVGICGGFTTFSSLSNDAFLLMQNREIFRLLIYAGLSFVLGLAAVFTGRLIIKFI
ncbi:MAG: fluoride efflux transporter CrcB [Sphingobacteriia bacterium]|nr:fluoride efflux transporter CrcB [Sphingobacteriia bacterium]